MTFNSSSNPPTVLVVDDTPTNLQVLFDVLQGQNYRVATATDGETAIARLDAFLPDLILLDVMMPGIDGFETCRRIKAKEATQDIPIIFMTALSDTADKVKGLTLGAVDYIAKPLQHEEVLARIRVQLQLRHLNQSLALRIAERDQSLQDLKQAQSRLIQSEKMSSLGQLVAGVAHEINNPINFIHGNMIHVEQYCQSLVSMVRLYQKEYSPTPAIQQCAEELELDYVCEDIAKLTTSMNLGTERVMQLVRSLRNFSRLDESEHKIVDIHEGINSTLAMLSHRLNASDEKIRINVVRDFGNIPHVECYPSQLNQAIMNFMTNAIDAIEIAQPSSPTISIRTENVSDQWVAVTIADNGTGISADDEANLFDPFFTTKPVGKGTGLGLSISHQIITEEHGGKIDYQSTAGQGTEFVIQIPVRLSFGI
ncbi:MAG: response regulator [Cyanobacteria bacterium P01_A01_bin.116]